MNKLPSSVLLIKGKMLVSFVLIFNQWISYVSGYNLPRARIAVTAVMQIQSTLINRYMPRFKTTRMIVQILIWFANGKIRMCRAT